MDVYPWLILGGAMLGLLLLSFVVYHYFADPRESYALATAAVVLSLTVSILCAMLIPVDIYVISAGGITARSLHVTISKDHVRTAYLALFASLLVLAFGLVPHAYFYGEERGAGAFDDKVDRRSCVSAFRSTALFLGLVVFLLAASLNFRPGHTESVDGVWAGQQQAARWVGDLLDAEHSGLNAISFSIACLTFCGVVGWVFYTAYGMAAMPFAWLRGKQSAAEQRQDLEVTIASIREKCRAISARYPSREDGSLDLSAMKAIDRKELNRLQREQKSLMQQNYTLQEIEQKAGMVIPRLLQSFVPFRWAIGMGMLCISLLVAVSLLLTLVDRLLHSDCGWRCGFTLKERRIFNPADDVFLRLSRVFPMDFMVLGILVLYIFAASVFGIVSLGIRVLCFSVYALRARRSLPQALLVLCNVLSYILLALCMALLTIAPDYTTFGSQSLAASADGSLPAGRCTLARQEARSGCQVSVISTFFTRIALAMPAFSVAYFFANWAYITVFACVFVRCLLFEEKQPYLDDVPECEEEEMGLLSFS
uniref:Lysosomal cobalamin transporter n=1 Tax=Zooxanthella nutricula TaxID=1333877 RepID=A0A6U6TFW2_9DINO